MAKVPATVAMLYIIVEVTGDGTVIVSLVPVRAMRGIKIPLWAELISSLAAGVVVPTPTFWAFDPITTSTHRSNIICFKRGGLKSEGYIGYF